MTTEKLEQPSPLKKFLSTPAAKIAALIAVLYVFLVALKLMGAAFKGFGSETSEEILSITSNPFVSLFLGMLATAVVQSSSTTTTMVVALVGSGQIGVDAAVPLIMGANIGTSVTSSLLAFAHIGKKKEYRRAVASATVHDFFNILVVFILLPLELIFGLLSKTAIWFTDQFTSEATTNSTEQASHDSGLNVIIKPVVHLIQDLAELPYVQLAIALALLFFSLHYLTALLKKLIIGRVEQNLDTVVFKKPFPSLLWGAGLTMMVQSSSVTTSLMVPMVAANKVSLKKVFPFLMGANIGTTVTALIAAIANNNGSLAGHHGLTIAIVHVLFNVFGVVLFFPIERVRQIPIDIAKMLGEASYKNRLVGILYVVITFFVLPLSLYLISR